MELVPVNGDCLELGVRHFDLWRIVFLIQPRMNLKAGRGSAEGGIGYDFPIADELACRGPFDIVLTICPAPTPGLSFIV